MARVFVAVGVAVLLLVVVAGCSGGTDGREVLDSAASLTVQPECGHGVQAGTPADDAVLYLTWVEPADADQAGFLAPGPIDDWQGELHLGADLLSQWCGDSFAEGDPEPRVDEVLRVVGGCLEILGDEQIPLLGSVTVRARSLVVARDDERYELGDIDITNSCWGCVAV